MISGRLRAVPSAVRRGPRPIRSVNRTAPIDHTSPLGEGSARGEGLRWSEVRRHRLQGDRGLDALALDGGKAKVAQAWASVGVNEDVSGLDVAVEDPGFVSGPRAEETAVTMLTAWAVLSSPRSRTWAKEPPSQRSMTR